MNLSDIFDLKSPAQHNRLKGTRQVYQIESPVITVKDMCEVEISMTVVCFVEFLYEVRQPGDEISSGFQIPSGRPPCETVGQFSFQRCRVRDFLRDDEAPLFEEAAPLLAVADSLRRIYAERRQSA